MANLPWGKSRTKDAIQVETMNDLGTVEDIPNDVSDSPSTYAPINLIRMIQDHAPSRLEVIEQTIKEYQTMIDKLREEAVKLERVLKAVE